MKFAIGEIPENLNHDFEEYLRLREPDKPEFMKIAGGIQVILWGLFFLAWRALDSESTNYFAQTNLLGYLIILLIILPLHELLHAVIYPMKNHDQIIFGVSPKMGVFYAMYEGELTRNRWVLVYVTPFFLISVVPMIVALYTPIPFWLVIASIINAGFAAGDLAAIAMIFYQVPKQALIVQNGWDTYWKSTVDKPMQPTAFGGS